MQQHFYKMNIKQDYAQKEVTRVLFYIDYFLSRFVMFCKVL